MATAKPNQITPELQYLIDRLEDRWNIAFGDVGFTRPPQGNARIAEKKRLLMRCDKLYAQFNDYLHPTHWLHVDAISILLRDYYKV